VRVIYLVIMKIILKVQW